MNLREMREESKLSLSEASKELDIVYDYLSALENGRRKPSTKLIFKMAKLYRKKPEQIFLEVARTECSAQ